MRLWRHATTTELTERRSGHVPRSPLIKAKPSVCNKSSKQEKERDLLSNGSTYTSKMARVESRGRTKPFTHLNERGKRQELGRQ